MFILPILYFSASAFVILKDVNLGSTIVYREGYLFSLRIYSGKINLTATQKKQKYVTSFSGPVGSALLGLLFFAAAQFLTVMLYLKPVYIF